MVTRLLKKILPVSIAFFLLNFAHPFFISVTELKYNAKEKTIQGSVKLFVNDFEDALKRINHKTVDLLHVKDTAYVNGLMIDYLKKHLQLNLNGKPRSFDFIGFEHEEGAIWMYIEFKKCEAPKTISLQNTLLFDFLKDQTSIVHVTVGDSQKSLKATNPEKDFLFAY